MKLVVSWVAAVSIAACSTHVKQAHAPGAEEFAEGGESDISAGPEKGPAPVIKSVNELKVSCCAECAEALAKDKTGDDPTKIPCVDFTAELKEECLNFFRKSPMMAAESKACAAEAPKTAPKSEDAAP